MMQAHLLPAQSSAFRFTNYTFKQGLSNNNVNCILKDSRGFIWAGTDDGLNLFDGHTFRIFRHNRFDSLSLPGNTVKSISEDHDGFLWIGTNDGIAKMNVWNGECESFHTRAHDSTALISDFENHVFVDHEQRIWICNSAGISQFDSQSKTFHYLFSRDEHGMITSSMTEENSNSLWFASRIGLVHFIPSRNSWTILQPYPGIEDENLVTSICIDHRGTMWCGVWGGGLCRYNAEEKKISGYLWDFKSPNRSAVNIVTSIIETEDGHHHHHLLVGTGQGLLVVDNENFPDSIAQIPFITHNPSDPQSIAHNFVNYISEDDQHIVWIGTEGGMSCILPLQQVFKVFQNIIHGDITKILRADSSLYITSWYGNGLTICDQEWNVRKTLARIPPDATSIDNGQVSDVIQDTSGNLWIATFNGLVRYSNGHCEVFHHDKNDSTTISDSRVTSVAEDHRHHIWAGTYGGGLNLYDSAAHRFIHFNHSEKNDSSLADDLIWQLKPGRQNRLWIASNSGLCYYDDQKNSFINFSRTSIGNTIVHDVYEDAGGSGEIIWVATDKGLNRLNVSSGTAEFFSMEEGLLSYDADGLIDDDEGNIWVGTPAGISRFNAAKKTFTNYSVRNGLPQLPLHSVFYKDERGMIWDGGSNGILMFDPRKLNQKSQAPPVYITDVYIANQPLMADAIHSSSPIHLHYDQNLFIIAFTAPEFNDPEAIHYLLKLDGVDANWVDAGSRNSATYVSLSPGSYLFHVKAQNADGATSTREAMLHFIIAPPFWKTWWFISLCMISAAVIFFFVVRYVTTRKLREQLLILEKEKAVEQERTRISRDMHDDLGSGLTKIAILSEVTQRQLQQPEKAEKQLHTISDSARALVDNLNEIIWTLNPQHDNLDSLMAYIRDYATRYFDATEIATSFSYPAVIPSLHLTDQQRRNIFLVVKESLNNISKHAQASRVIIELKMKENNFEILISDNGKGFEVENSRAGANGLKNMKHRMKNIGGDYSITSTIGKGTITTMSMKY